MKQLTTTLLIMALVIWIGVTYMQSEVIKTKQEYIELLEKENNRLLYTLDSINH